VFVHGGPAVTLAPEHDGLPLADGLLTCAGADHGGDIVAEDGGIAEVLDDGCAEVQEWTRKSSWSSHWLHSRWYSSREASLAALVWKMKVASGAKQSK
jgi:hypothetical protein